MLQTKFNFLLIVLILLFALYEALFVLLNKGIKNMGLKILSGIVIFAILYVGMQRNTYLPFLGPAVLPPSLLKSDFTPEDAEQMYRVKMNEQDGTKVLYWAAQESEKIFKDPWKAYGDYINAGISTVKNGEAVFTVKCPSSYKVSGAVLKPHIHYRIAYPKGVLGEIKTIFVEC
jgi:hypothetical protein